MPINHRCQGFTLLEVMLAMTLLSIMVVLLFSSLQIGAESWNKGEKKIAEVNEKAVVFQFFKQHLPSIRPLSNEFNQSNNPFKETESPFSFAGKVDEFQFVSVFPASANRKGLHLFEVIFDPRDDLIKVILQPYYPNAQGDEWEPEEVILLEKVDSLKVAYFDRDESVWEPRWQEKTELPALIKIKIELLDQSYWPEMIFHLKLSGYDIDNSHDDLDDIDQQPFTIK